MNESQQRAQSRKRKSNSLRYLGLLLLTGCQACNSLIVHPLHVLHQMHKNQESVRAFDQQSTTNNLHDH